MNLEELRSVQRAERQKDSLQHLRDSFYTDVADYIAQLKDERERAVAAAGDPFASEDVRQLTDKIESTKEISNALYERRVGKVVKHASFAAADMSTDEDGMTTEERELFDDLVARIRENREEVLATLEGRGAADSGVEKSSSGDDEPSPATDTASRPDAVEPSDPSGEPAAAEPADDLLSDALGDTGTADTEPATDEPSTPPADPPTPSADPPDLTSETEPTPGPQTDRPAEEAAAISDDGSAETATPPADGSSTPSKTDEQPVDATTGERDSGPERTTLRITADVGTVYGVDEREYDLAREDVVMLPTTNAEPLLQKNAAERID